jgi:hypothetical protein
MGGDLRSQFARAVEAEYELRARRYRVEGLDPGEAHQRALQESKDVARHALQELCRRGLFPFDVENPMAGTGGGHA